MFNWLAKNRIRNIHGQYNERLRLLTLAFSEMLEINDLDKIYNYVGTTLRKYCKNSVILISIVDEIKNEIQPKNIIGLEGTKRKKEIAWVNPLNNFNKILPQHKLLFKSGKLNEIKGGPHDLTTLSLPEDVALTIISLPGIRKIYTIGINKDNQLLSVVHIFTLKKITPADIIFIELFISQAGIIVQKKLTEQALRDSKAHFESLANAGQALIWTSGLDKTCNYFNKTWLEFTGKSMEQELGIGWTEGVHPNDLSRCLDTYTTSFDNRKPFSMDYRLRRYDGEYRWIQDNGSPMYNSRGEFIGYIGHCLDISELKKAEEQHMMFRLGIERSDDIIYITEPDGTILYSNPSFERVYGYPLKEILGKTPGILKSGMARKEEYELFWNNLLAKKAIKGEIINKTNSGKLINIEGSINPILDPNGDLLGYLAVQHDITARKLGELQINKLNKAIDQSPVSIVITDTEGKIEYVNPYFSFLTGYSREEAIGQNPSILKTDENEKEFYRNLWQTITSGKEWRGEFKNKKKNGEIYYESAVIAPVLDDFGIIINYVAVKEDITERKKTEHDILLSNERLEGLLRIASYTSDNIQDLLDFALQEAIKLTESKIGYIYLYDEKNQVFRLSSWSKEVHAQCRIAEPSTIYDLNSTGCWGEAVRQRKAVIINDYSANHPMAKGIPEGHIALNKFLTIPVIVDRKIAAVVGVANKKEDYNQSDILQLTLMMDSVWKIVERQMMIEELITAKEKAVQSDNLKSAFLANMSHEIRTPMNAIMGFSELLAKTPLSGRILEKYCEIIHSRSIYLLTLIDDILDLSKVEAGILSLHPTHFNVNDLLEDLAIQFRLKLEKLHKNIKLVVLKENPDHFSMINSDKVRIQQVLSNLVDNAIKFTSYGSITLAYTSDINKGIIFSVTDTGMGISSKNHQLIFERFHKSNDYVLNYGGLGLGLSICKGIVSILGGQIWVESEPGQGAIFKFNIPVKFEETPVTDPSKIIETDQGNIQYGHVLLVEDDVYNVELFQNILSDFEVTVAENGESAIKLYNENPNIGVILMDIGLPDINGLEVTKKIRESGSVIPIIALTAFTSENDKHHCFEAGCNDFILKPVISKELVQKVSHHLSCATKNAKKIVEDMSI